MSTPVDELVKIGDLAAEAGTRNDVLITIAREHGLMIHYIATARLLSRKDADFVLDRFNRIHREFASLGRKRPAVAVA